MERQPETNTFHMSFGEMTITLNDVSTLVGIPMIGRSVKMPQRITNARVILVSLLGMSPQEADDELVMAGVAQFDWNGSDPTFPMSRILHQIDVFNALPDLICCIWSATLSPVTRLE